MTEIKETTEKLTEINQPIDMPKKKGRPKKIKEVELNVEPVEKKKRGRKKKEDIVIEEKKKKKRGRKATVKYFSSSIRKKLPLTTTVQDQNNFILHLDVVESENKDTNVEFDSNNNIDNTKYEIYELEKKILERDNKFTDIDKLEKEDLDKLYEIHLNDRELQENNIIYEDTKIKVEKRVPTKNLGFFKILNVLENENWIEHTDSCCWWCCHKFSSTPLGLPVYYNIKTSKFRVKGLFCSFACMTMYNDNSIKKVQNYMIKQLYSTLTKSPLSDVIKRAPPRESLQMFGGELTIDEFRQNFNESKIYKRVDYPMYISRDYIEEVDIKHTKNVNTSIFEDIFIPNNNSNSLKQINEAKRRLQTQIDKTTITKNTIDKFIRFN